jgi:uncharacterized protein YecT (DUF1311 family)
MHCRGLCVVNGVSPPSKIEGIGIGKKRFCAGFFYLFYDIGNMNRAYERIISDLTEMNLDRGQITWIHHIFKACRQAECLDLISGVSVL